MEASSWARSTPPFAVAAALARAGRTGEGCYIDVSSADAVITVKWLGALAMLNPDKIDESWGDRRQDGGARRISQVPVLRDQGWQVHPVCRHRDEVLEKLVSAAGREDLLAEHALNSWSTSQREMMISGGRSRRHFTVRTATEWMQIAVEHDIAMGPALRFDEIQDDPHLASPGSGGGRAPPDLR